MARLLFLSSGEKALEFAEAVGLPVENDCVVMKTAPISVSDNVLTWSRQEDAFVFGKHLAMDESFTKNSSRVDEDGVLIPPTFLLGRLITPTTS